MSQDKHEARRDTPAQGSGISSSDLEAAILRRCDSCQKPGGAIHDLADQVKELAKQVSKVLATLAGNDGERRVWAVLRFATVPISCVVLGFVLNYQGAKRSDEMLRRQTDIAAEVARQLKAVQDTAKSGHTMLPPELPVKDSIATTWDPGNTGPLREGPR